MYGNGDARLWISSSDSFSRPYSQKKLRGNDLYNHFMDPEIAELFSKSQSQEEEIFLLRKQIVDAYAKELQLLNEKHVLQRKLFDLQMALDGKHSDGISDALKDLTHRKDYVEENLRLADELRVVEEDKYIFTSSLLSLLSEFGIRPPLLDASTISNGTKRLYHQLQWKLRSSQAGTADINYLSVIQPKDIQSDHKHHPSSNVSRSQLSEEYQVPDVYSHQYNRQGQYVHPDSKSRQSRFGKDHEVLDMKEAYAAANMETQYPFVSDKQVEIASTFSKDVGDAASFRFFGDGPGEAVDGKVVATENSQFNLPASHYMYDSEVGELSPGIEAFQITGDAIPGKTLRASGFPIHGTSLCIFQWVRHLQDGTRDYIEGATNPEYVVTVDDVDKLLAVECIPMDDNGRQGELVRHFANNQDKVTCDPAMQQEIEAHVSTGRAIFNVLLLMDSEVWEQATLILKRSGYQVKVKHTDAELFGEKYSADLSLKVPFGHSTQFVLTSSDGMSHPFSTNGTSYPHNTGNDIRFRDLIVLTMRIFQAKVTHEGIFQVRRGLTATRK